MSLILLVSSVFLIAVVSDHEPEAEVEKCDVRQVDVRFEESSTTVWVGRNAVLTFHVDGGPSAASVLASVSSAPEILEVLAPAETVADARTGSIRVRGVSAGTASLSVGGTEIAVIVKPLDVDARAWQLKPLVVAPVIGAVCSGVVDVGVELVSADSRRALELELELPDGTRLSPLEPFAEGGSPTLRRRFEVDVDELAVGSHRLRVVVSSDGEEVAETATKIQVARPGAASLAGECEDHLEEERPEPFGPRSPRAGGGPSASAGGFVVLPRNEPAWVLPVTITKGGRYQLTVRARGDLAGGAFPSLSVAVGSSSPLAGSARLFDHRWQRLPLAGPLQLSPGEHHIAVRLLNDLDVGTRSDRELFLDSWELIQVESDEDVADASMMMMADADGGLRGPRGDGLWIGLERSLDGLEMNGRLWIQGIATWSGPTGSAAPVVELILDGGVQAAQQTARPSFALDRAHLGEGEHAVSLRASLPDGRSIETPVQRIRVRAPVAAAEPRDLLRFDVMDERWDGALTPFLDGQGEEHQQRVARPTGTITSRLELPSELVGTFEMMVEARAGGADRAATVTAHLEQAGSTGPELSGKVHDWWSLRPLGRVELQRGEKAVLVRLEPREGDSQLRVRSLVLRGVRGTTDRQPPVATLAYPAAGHVAYGVDAVVVDAFDDDAIESVDVLIDGRPQGTFGFVPPGAGQLLLPLLLRDVAPGEHSLSVRVVDREGNVGESERIPFTVLAEKPALLGRYARAVHLLNRLAFGPEPGELCRVLSLGEEAWLASALDGEDAGHAAALGLADARHADRIAYDADRLVLSYALRTNNPVRARFSLWIDDHFSTWAGKTGAPSEWAEHRDIARMGWAPLEEHMRQSATSASMLVYLDQDRSYAGRLNENYARELLELHTVGVHGGYDQADVTNLAGLLAGLTVSQEAPMDGSGMYQRRAFRFDPELSDGAACTLFERSFAPALPAERFDRYLEVVELLARRPETADFLARKLVEHYVSVPAPEPLVEHMASTYTRSGGDPRALLRVLLAHEDFWDAAETPRLATPLDYGLRVARVSGNPAVDWSLREFLQNSGMGLFDRVTPDGYPDDDAAWADTNGLMQRWRWIQKIPWAVNGLVPGGARGYAGGDPRAWRQRIVDHAAVRLTGWTLGEASNAAALEFFEADETAPWQQVNNVIELICRLPEANFK